MWRSSLTTFQFIKTAFVARHVSTSSTLSLQNILVIPHLAQSPPSLVIHYIALSSYFWSFITLPSHHAHRMYFRRSFFSALAAVTVIDHISFVMLATLAFTAVKPQYRLPNFTPKHPTTLPYTLDRLIKRAKSVWIKFVPMAALISLFSPSSMRSAQGVGIQESTSALPAAVKQMR